MASPSKLLFVLFLCYLSSFTAMARPLGTKSPLLERLKLDKEGSSSCWDSLLELQSCTGEVVLFFLNGETYLGSNCCRAIRTIENHCWPSMLGSIGIDAEEGDILLGYCDSAVANDSSSPPQPKSSQGVVDSINMTTASHVVTP